MSEILYSMVQKDDEDGKEKQGDMQIFFLDFKQVLQEKLAELSEQETVLAIYLQHRPAVLGALTQLLEISLTEVLLGQASINSMDVLVLSFSEPQQARDLFFNIPKKWRISGEKDMIQVQVWHQGRLEAENS